MVLLNLDAGEHDDEPEALWSQFDLLNIASGGHAGDASSMERVVRWCVQSHCAIGGHPSYPDRAQFGRKTMAIAPSELTASVAAQLRALVAIATRHGRTVDYVKPHGALYHDANRDSVIAEAVVSAIADALGSGNARRSTTVIGPPSGALCETAAKHGLAFAREGFADRRMRSDGSLVPRGEPNALITDPSEAAAQARALSAQVDTICVHADTPGAIAIAEAVHKALRG